MQKKEAYKLPLRVLLLIIATCVTLYYGSSFLIPLTYGAMFAFLVRPFFRKLEGWGINRYLSAMMSVSTIIFLFLILLSVFGWQIQQLYQQSSQIQKELVKKQKAAQQVTKKWFGISMNEQSEYIEKGISDAGKKVTGSIGSLFSILGNFFLSLVYAILLLSERERIKIFFLKLFDSDAKAKATINQTGDVVQSYLVGKLSIVSMLAVVYAVGFSLVGIQFGVLIGVLSAFLTFIPYVGNIIAAVIVALITMATGGSYTDIAIVFTIMGIAQLLESYVFEPWIVGSNVSLNPLFSIIGVIGMSLLWGAAGSIIALPLCGILKILFDHVQPYKSLGFLMEAEPIDIDEQN